MPIPMNANPESAALIGGAWPEYDESTYRADAETQRKLSGTAEDGAGVTRQVGDRTSGFQGAAGSALQDALSRDRSQLTSQQTMHHATAAKLENLASAIENHKNNLNAIDASYHTQKATMIASGADPTDLAHLQAQAQTAVGTAQATFGSAYEGMVDTLLADADAADGKPKPAPGGVELSEFKDGEPGAPTSDADKDDKGTEDAPNDIDSGGDTKADGKQEGDAPESAPAVDDKAGAAPPIAAVPAAPAAPAPAATAPAAPAPAPAAPAAPAGVGGVGAVPAAPAAAGSTQAKDMGYATGQAATQFGAGLLSGIANQPAPGSAAPAQFGQTGYGPQAFGQGMPQQGFPQQGYGQGFGGMPQAGAMNGYGQMNPAAFGQAAVAPLTEAGNALGQFANQTANAMTGHDTGLAGLLGETLAGDQAGEHVPAAADGPATELKSQVIDAIDQYLDDPASTDAGGSDSAPEAPDADAPSADSDAPSDDSDAPKDDSESASDDSAETHDSSDEADKASEAPAPPSDSPAAPTPDASADPAGTPITANPTETVDPITRLQHGAGAAVDQVAMGLHGAIDGTADTARHLAGFPPVDASAPATHTSAGAAPSFATGLSANDLGHTTPAHSAPSAAMAGSGVPVGGTTPMMGPAAPAAAPAGGPANIWTPPPAGPTPPHTPQQPYGSGQPGPAHSNPAGPAVGGDGRISHTPPPPTAAAANAEAAAILSGLPSSEVRAHQVLAALRKQQSVIDFVTPTAVGVFTRGESVELIVATADGISYLPEGAGLPEGVRLITDYELPEGYYRHWSGYFSPVAKLADLSQAAGHRVGTLTLALSSEPDRAHNSGVQSFVQTADQFLRLSNGGALAPAVRGRAQSAAPPTRQDQQAVATMAADHSIHIEDYNELAAQVQAARWHDPDDADQYRWAWLRFLVCGALRAEQEPDSKAGLGYAIAELRRAVFASTVDNRS